LRCGKDGRPIVTAIQALPIPVSAIELEKQLKVRMPERQLLEAITNSEHWTEWSRHFGPPSRLSSQIKEATRRYVLATFAYGCGLGPTEAARHLNGTVSADQLAFVDRRHVDIADLRAASADLINLYLQFELVGQWGTGEAAVADGTHFEIYEDNLLAEHHIRYGQLHRALQSLYCLRHLRGEVHSRYTFGKSLRRAPETRARRYPRAIGGGVWVGLSARH